MGSLLPSFFIGLAGLCLVLVLVNLWQSLRHVLSSGGGEALHGHGPGVAERDTLLTEKQELLTAIRDVRFERDLGKVSEEDFERLDARYRARAREVLKALDEQVAPYRSRAARLLDGEGAEADAPAADVEPVAGEGASADVTPDARTCGDCGTVNEDDANFCKKCAAPLPEVSK